MSAKEQFDSYKELAHHRLKRWEVRVNLEWKVSFALWTLLVGGSYAIRDTPPPLCWSIPAAVVVFALYAVMWFYPVAVRHKQDQYQAFHYMECAATLLPPLPLNSNIRSPLPNQSHCYELTLSDLWSASFQAVVTLFSIGISFYLLYH
jgi:hypothetical protein